MCFALHTAGALLIAPLAEPTPKRGDRLRKTCAVAELVAHLIRLCAACDIYFVIEQPRSSLFFDFEPVKAALLATEAVQVSFSLGRAGATSVKPMRLYGTAPWMSVLAARISARPMLGERKRLAPRRGNWVVGNRRALTASAEYPLPLCRMVAVLQKEEQQRRVLAENLATPVIDLDSD